MPIKFEIDKADNGNKFLCEDCHHCIKRSGTLHNIEYFCNFIKPVFGIGPITFEVTQCTQYVKKSFIDEYKKSESYQSLQRQAYFYVFARSRQDGNLRPYFLTYEQYTDYEYSGDLPDDPPVKVFDD